MAEEKTISIAGARSGGVVVQVRSSSYGTPESQVAFERGSETDEQYASRITKAINEEIYGLVMERLKQIREKEQEARKA